MKVTNALQAFHVMAKPTGAICNLDCAYCFFLSKEQLYPNSTFVMSDDVMESYIRQTIEAHSGPEITIAWQGGEPTLMGRDFFRRAMGVVKRYQKPGTMINNTIQTNGVLLNEEWCTFLRENNFLVGISVDGPRHMHDVYRVDKGGQPTFDKVLKAVRLMQRMNVEFNVLCTINSVNAQHPLEVYRFFRDELGARYIQLIPIVERINDDGRTVFQQGSRVTDRSVASEQYGRFLNAIYDEWVSRDVGEVFIQLFDGILMSWYRGESSLCIFRSTCGDAVALEHNGDLYSCDHFVEPKYLVGNILKTPLVQLMASDQQRRFGQDKSDSLPKYCRKCEYLFACHGECPKNRFINTPDGEPGLNYLCAGLKSFFKHVDRPMQIMAELLRRGRLAEEAVPILKAEEARLAAAASRVGRNDPCPCGSGVKAKRCHARHMSACTGAESDLDPLPRGWAQESAYLKAGSSAALKVEYNIVDSRRVSSR
jgi:uncharacterized protein